MCFGERQLQNRGIFVGSGKWMKFLSEMRWKQMAISNSLASLPSASYTAGNLGLARAASLNRQIFISTTRATHAHTCSWIMITEGEVSLSRGKPF